MNEKVGTQRNALLGFTNSREHWASNGFMHMQKDGSYKAWWQGEDFDGAYEAAIPVEDVHSRMLSWEAQEADVAVKLYVTEGDYHGQDEGGYFRWVADNDRKAIVRADNEAIFMYPGRDSYQMHGYMPVLEQCGKITDSGELGIASAFIMDKGAVFVANMELPDDITTEQGITHRVKLMVSTSMNGRFATQWKISDEFAVCSNSFNLNLSGKGNEFRVKHTSKSLGKIGDARNALGLVYKAAEEYTKFLDAMTKVDVTPANFQAIMDGLFTMPVAQMVNGKVTNQAAITRMDNKRDQLLTMYATNPMVKPFHGTLFGAFQAWSTWNQHEKPRGDALAAQIIGDITGKTGEVDAEFFAIVQGLEGLDLSALVAV